ncbi:hypothetical protein LPJ66_004939 [Kickxella alabastrina]|uniref:Uncharacterized protein n=1 Tax=Kickxella alabastrina TaxID=61397 RepID=A0ACC1IJQ7_9FUNG|nr:hypothetical protein LPJ66_004939 [Kickxella alabastrina]
MQANPLPVETSRTVVAETNTDIQPTISTDENIDVLINVKPQPFERLPISNSGIADIVPSSQLLQKALSAANLGISQTKLMGLANRFVSINSTNADVSEPMEQWRKDVLDAFDSSLKDITRVAGMLVKLSNNKSLAFALYKVAAEEGYQNAAHYYAVILGTRSMKQKGGQSTSASIIRELVTAGHPPSYVVYADVLLAKATLESTLKAIALLERAAEAKLAMASFNLGDIYRKGETIDKDYQKAAYWFAKAADQSAAEGYFMLGNMYSQGQATEDGKPDFEKAFVNFEKAALAGIVEAQFNVGGYYLEGKGVGKNANLAVEYWLMAAAKRFPIAALNLGKLFVEGKEVPKNIRRARDMLNLAIELTDPEKIIEQHARALLAKLEHQKGKGDWCTIM